MSAPNDQTGPLMTETSTPAYSANPIAEQYQQTDPGPFAGKSAAQQPPKMFVGGTADVPLSTVSGLDPQALLALPPGIRHAIAEMPDIREVHATIEMYGGTADAEIDSQGLRDARSRMRTWFDQTPDARPAEVIAAEQQAALEAYQRATAPDGLTPSERAEKRNADWAAKQAARQREDDARWARVAAKENQRFQAALARESGRGR